MKNREDNSRSFSPEISEKEEFWEWVKGNGVQLNQVQSAIVEAFFNRGFNGRFNGGSHLVGGRRIGLTFVVNLLEGFAKRHDGAEQINKNKNGTTRN